MSVACVSLSFWTILYVEWKYKWTKMSKSREWYILLDMSWKLQESKWQESKWREPKWQELLVIGFGSKGVGLTWGTCHLGFEQEGDDGEQKTTGEWQ